VIALLLLGIPLLLAAGRVQTRDGRTLDGEVSAADGALVVRAASGEVRVGMAQVSRAWFDYQPAPTPEAGLPLPRSWNARDVGSVFAPGSSACDAGGVFTLTASGWGAWGAKDSFQFAYRALRGDGQVIARVVKLDDSRGPVVAGVMIRESLAPDGMMGATCVHGTGEVHFTRRPATGPLKDFKLQDPDPKAGGWVRITRRGDELMAFRSVDGKYWQRVDQHKVPMGQDVLAGVCAWTTGNAWTSAAVIDNVLVVPGTPGLTWFAGGDPMLQGIVFRDGNKLAATIVAAEKETVRYERDGKAYTAPVDRVARLVFSPVPPDMASPGGPGILLANGDYVEGDVGDVSVQAVEWPRPAQLKAAVRSVLLGTRSFEVAREVVLVDYGRVTPAPAAYEVQTKDGSVTRAKVVTLRQDGGVEADGVLVRAVVEIGKL
jgi:hypothetical protein